MDESGYCPEALGGDPPVGASPETVVYAAAAGRFAVERYRDRAWATCPPRSLDEIRMQALGLREALVQMLGREPSIEEVAEALRLEGEAAQVEAASQVPSASTV
ncbi:hypothetical protein [Sinomonas susongensis]|uniref:hypothetical protein n=1 Tax=Sinomonas susongensis TaxID=1324851 RepID=UPI001107E414|nr:hypothetical protein [Sinomonas susongensis]